jgi:hypothetical protein
VSQHNFLARAALGLFLLAVSVSSTSQLTTSGCRFPLQISTCFALATVPPLTSHQTLRKSQSAVIPHLPRRSSGTSRSTLSEKSLENHRHSKTRLTFARHSSSGGSSPVGSPGSIGVATTRVSDKRKWAAQDNLFRRCWIARRYKRLGFHSDTV